MKKKYMFYCMLILVASVLGSCDMFKVTEKYAPKIQTPGTIQFQVADGALTGTAFVGVVQPSTDVSAARFAKAATTNPANYFAGNAVLTINLTSPLTNVTINLLSTTSAGAITREQKAVFNGVSGSLTWTAPISTIGAGGSNPANNATLIIEVVATDSAGTKVNSRTFSLTVIA